MRLHILELLPYFLCLGRMAADPEASCGDTEANEGIDAEQPIMNDAPKTGVLALGQNVRIEVIYYVIHYVVGFFVVQCSTPLIAVINLFLSETVVSSGLGGSRKV